MVVFQKDGINITKEKSNITYYATSFEEAVILENYENDILHDVLKTVLGNKFKDIVGTPHNYLNLAHNSNKIQKLLTKKKSEFSNLLIYSLVTKESNKPKLPLYLRMGLNWLSSTLDNREVSDEF
jgi:hypothetical protein